MTENTNTTTANTKTTENTFGKALKNVLLFPYRVIYHVTKWVLILYIVVGVGLYGSVAVIKLILNAGN